MCFQKQQVIPVNEYELTLRGFCSYRLDYKMRIQRTLVLAQKA